MRTNSAKRASQWRKMLTPFLGGYRLITAWLEVRVLRDPPRILVLTEISPNPAISPELAGFLRVGFVSRSPRLELRRLFGPFVSGLKIPFPGNGDLGSKRLVRMGVLVIRKTSIFAQYSKAATVQSFSDLAAGWGLPPARTRRVSSIGQVSLRCPLPLIVSEPAVTSSAWPPPNSDCIVVVLNARWIAAGSSDPARRMASATDSVAS